MEPPVSVGIVSETGDITGAGRETAGDSDKIQGIVTKETAGYSQKI